jgi:hypothetical protein
MELHKLVKDMAALQDGRWVDKAEVPSLGDMRVKMRGSHTATVRQALGEKERAGVERGEAFEQVLADHCLLEIEGLVNGGKPVTVDDLRPILREEAAEPLRLILLDVIRAVDATRESKALDLSKN